MNNLSCNMHSITVKQAISLMTVWLILVGLLFSILLNYKQTAGTASQVVEHWPQHSKIVPIPGKFNLVLFAHPQCPCTRSSIQELAKLMKRLNNVRAAVVFIRPSQFQQDWVKTAIWHNADSIPGVICVEDLSGKESQRFGVHTSGETLLYDPQGRLLFTGGITASRGHEGDNLGADIIGALASGRTGLQNRTPVFGCPLADNFPERKEL